MDRRTMAPGTSRTSRAFAAIVFGAVCAAAPASATLTVTPITWNVIGLDSNSPTAGPKDFPVGVRVCSNVATTLVGVVWSFDSANPNINLRPGSLSSITIPSIGVGACADAYFEVEITQVPAAYDTTRRYHVTATDLSGSASSPTPRELYVEHLISQNRNSTTGMKLDGVSIPAGGSMTLVVGNTYTIELDGATATQGYEQLEEFISFPNTIFQILSVSTMYSADTSLIVPNPNDKLYADACGWDNDPNSPTYRSCAGADAKAGGTVITTYTVQIISGGGTSQTLNSLIHDFSGSSFHYNSDFSSGARIATIIDPSLVTLSKKFAPNPTNVGGVSTLTFTLSNPNAGIVSGLNFSDVFPTSPGAMVVATPPAAATTGCGTPTFAPVAGAASISFSSGTVAANGSCTVRVNVTVPATGTYSNTSNHLFIGTVDTGNSATDTLTVNAAPPPPSCVPGVTLANWSVPNGTVANPPDLAGGVPTVKAANVATATLTANVPADTGINTTSGHVDTTSWSTFGYKNGGQFIQFTLDTSNYTAVQMSFWVANPSPANGPSQITVTVNSGSGFGSPVLTINSPASAFTTHAIDLTGLTNTAGNTLIRITATGANNDANGASLLYDDMVFTGCAVPLPPTISKAFAPNPVAVGAISTLTFTVTNPNGGIALSGVSFTDTLPAGVTAPNSSTPTCGGTLTISSNVLTFAGGTLAAGASCSIPVTVTATTAGPHVNVSGFVSSTQGGTNAGASGIASASLTAVLPPVIAKQFAPNPILPGGVSTLTFTISNPNENDALSSVAFSDTLPTSPGAMVVAGTPAASFSGCGAPTFSPVAGAGSVTFSGGTIAGGGTCTVTVNVTAPVVGTYTNTSGNVSHVINASTVNGNAATGSLTVNPTHPAIGVLKQVGLSNNPLGTWDSFLATTAGTNVFYKITIENDGDVPLTSVSASDPNVNLSSCSWPSPLPVAVAGNDNHIAVCVVGPVVAVSGLHPNTVTASGTGGSTVTHTSSASYATTGLTLAKSVAESTFTAAGNVLHYSYLVTNSGFAPLQGPVTVSDSKATASCPAVTTVGDLDDFLDPSESITCTATYTVTAGDVAAKFVTNVASASVAGVNSPTDSKTVPLLAAPAISKSFAAPNVALNGSVNLSLVLMNPGGTTLTGLAFLDNLPSGLTTPDASTAICGGTLTISSNSLSLAGGSLLAGASCTIAVSVTGTTAGVKNNTTGPISSNETGSGATSNTATVTVVSPPTISKAFGSSSIALNGSTSLTLTIQNPNSGSSLTGVAFTDNLPAGLVVATPNGLTNTCGGTATAVAGSGTASLSGATVAASGSCAVVINVSGTTSGIKNNTTGPISSTETGPGATSNTATVTVVSPPTISKAFSSSSIALNGSTSLTLTIQNPNSGSSLTGVAFTDNLPAGLVVATPSGLTSTCGGTPTATAGSGSASLSGATVAASGSCTVVINVTGTTSGIKNNTTGPISSTEGGIGTTSNTTTVTVAAPGAPTISKSFASPTVTLGGGVNMSFALTNPGGTGLTGLAFMDTLPAGLTAANGTTATCGGSLTISAGDVLTFAGGMLAASASCTITVSVTGTTAGVKNNTTGPISSTETGPGAVSNTATVAVIGPPTITKAFGAPSISFGGTTSLTLTLTNPNATVALSGLSFTDTLPAGLTVPNTTTTPCGGTLTISGNVLSFTGGMLAAAGGCTITVTVTGATSGIKNNTTGPISSTEGGIGTTSNTATVTVAPAGAPTIAKSFASPTVALGGAVDMSFVLTNPGGTLMTGLSFTDSLPAGLTAPNGTTPTCGGSLAITGGDLLTFAGGTLAASANCTITVAVTGATAGVQNNTTGPIGSNETGPGAVSNTATVTVLAPPTIAKAFGATSIALNGTTSLDLTLTNPNATVALSGLSFTDALPAGLTAPNGTTSACGGSLAITGGNVLTFTGGTLARGASCTISTTVTGTTAGGKDNTTSALTSSGPVSLAGTASNTATVTIAASPGPPPSDIPALGPWMLLALTLLLAWEGARLARR